MQSCLLFTIRPPTIKDISRFFPIDLMFSCPLTRNEAVHLRKMRTTPTTATSSRGKHSVRTAKNKSSSKKAKGGATARRTKTSYGEIGVAKWKNKWLPCEIVNPRKDVRNKVTKEKLLQESKKVRANNCSDVLNFSIEI